MKLFTDAAPVVRWFTKQQRYGGGYGSTQVGTPPFRDANTLHV